MPAAALNPERLVLDSEKFLDAAQTAYSRRELNRAEEYLFLAADRIEQLLPLSPAGLIGARLKAVEEIGDFIEQIQGEKFKDCKLAVEPGSQASGKPTERALFSVEEKPAIKLADVAGMSTLKELIRTKLIYPLRDPETTKKYGVKRGAGILLYGPPGTGKSMIARAIAGEFDAAFISIKASDVLDCLYGQTEKNIAALFAQAKKYPAAVIFLDELDGLGADRDASDSHMRRFINQLLIELQGFSDGLENIIVLGATNKPWLPAASPTKATTSRRSGDSEGRWLGSSGTPGSANVTQASIAMTAAVAPWATQSKRASAAKASLALSSARLSGAKAAVPLEPKRKSVRVS